MDNQEANSPLINDYKLKYLLQVIPQTFLGGLRLRFPFKLPWFVHGIQIFLWSFPFIGGSLLTLICELSDSIDKYIIAIGYALLMFICTLVCNAFLLKVKRHVDGVKKVTNNFFMEEDEIELTSCFSLDTFEFILAKKKFLLNLVFHPLLYGATCGISLLFLLPRKTETYLDSKAGSIVYYFIGWFVVCVAVYPLIGKPPKEPNIFRFNDNLELASATRVFYVLLTTVTSHVLGTFGAYLSIQLVILSIFICFPVLWLFGFLPSIDVLMLWSAEQLLVHCLGGSSMATDLRLIVIFLLSLASAAVLYFISHKLVALVLCAVLGVLLSTDICSMIFKCIAKLSCRPLEFSNRLYLKSHSYKEYILLFISILLGGVATALVERYHFAVDKGTFLDICGCLLIIVIVCCEILQGLQKILIFWFIQNPLFTAVADNSFVQKLVVCLLVGFELYILPILLVSLGTFIVETDKFTESFVSIILLLRLYRKIWQNTNSSSHDFLVYIILYWSNFANNAWFTMNAPVQMFLISLGLHWVKSFFKKCWFVCLLICCSKTLKGDQTKWYSSIALLCFFFPVFILVLCLSVILSTPVLPLFTLPVFIMGFPRPLRMWPNAEAPTKSSSRDWIYYKQLTPSLIKELKLYFRNSSKPQAGSYFIARFQDRLIWISVLEAGLFYNMITMKGLELQETSCHTREAESVDGVFNVNIEDKTLKLNRKIMHIMEFRTILQMNVYSDAKSVLTGIIDNPEFSDKLSKYFPKILLWVLLKYSKHRRDFGIEDIPNDLKTGSPDKDYLRKSDAVLTTLTALSENRTVTNNSVSYTPRKERCGVKPVNVCASSVEEDESDDEFGGFGFSDKESISTEDDDISNGDNNANTINHISRGDSKVLDPPSHWLFNLPYNEVDIMSASNSFFKSWYHYLINSVCDEKHLEDVLKDLRLAQNYKLLIMNCYYLLEKGDMKHCSERKGPIHFVDMFHGKLPWSPRITWIEDHKSLKFLVVQAYRLAFKLVYDNFVLGQSLDDEDLLATLDDHEENSFLGEEEGEDWMNNVVEEKPSLFTIGQNKNGTFTSRMLTLQTIPVPIATLNEECVRGFWSALSLELYYMTNDDEERYSIQALPQLLRNIVTQAADPPLGYPVFSSGLIRVPII